MEGNDWMTAKSWLCTGWQTYKKNWCALALGGLLWFIWDLTLVCRNYLLCGIGIPLPFFVIWDGLFSIISVGLCFFCLKLSRGLEAPFSTIFEGFRIWWTALVVGEVLKLIGRITTGQKWQLFYTVLISYGPALVLGVGATILCAYFPSNFSTCLVVAACLVAGCLLDMWAACSLAVAYDSLKT